VRGYGDRVAVFTGGGHSVAITGLPPWKFHVLGKEFLVRNNTHVEAVALVAEETPGSPLFQRPLGFLHNISTGEVLMQPNTESDAVAEVLDALGTVPLSALRVDAAGLVQNSLMREEAARKKPLDTRVGQSPWRYGR
jgi:hypothetical protein